MTTKIAEDFDFIAQRLKELEREKQGTNPTVTEQNPPDYVEPADSGDAWYYDPCGG